MRFTGNPEEPDRPQGWNGWYRFARDELGLAHDERVEYANHRFVEEQNRESLRRRSTEKPRGPQA